MVQTQEEMLEELLQEVQATRRYAAELHKSSTRVIDLVEEMLGSQDPSAMRSNAEKARYERDTKLHWPDKDITLPYIER